MAGRGTDIVLGGNLQAEIAKLEAPDAATIAKLEAEWRQRHEQVIAAGGLHIIGTERHESRRIDNQLRGRSGRQGDPGTTRFYLSLQDNLMRIFASDRVAALMRRLGMGQGIPIEHSMVTKAIENAQRKVEARNFDIRKQLLEFDDVANDQRKVIYEQRAALLAAEDLTDTIAAIRHDVIQTLINRYIPPQSLEEQWQVKELEEQLAHELGFHLPIQSWLEEDAELYEEKLRDKIFAAVEAEYHRKEAQVGSTIMRQLEKTIMLQCLDVHWKEHLAGMEQLRQGIHLRGYAQKNPKQEYKREAFTLFASMLERLKQDVLSILCMAQVKAQEDIEKLEQQRRAASTKPLHFEHAQAGGLLEPTSLTDDHAKTNPSENNVTPFMRPTPKVGRNDPCPCHSGKKYKQCHGRLA
jgi:preprotein translocase subunit SecA